MCLAQAKEFLTAGKDCRNEWRIVEAVLLAQRRAEPFDKTVATRTSQRWGHNFTSPNDPSIFLAARIGSSGGLEGPLLELVPCLALGQWSAHIRIKGIGIMPTTATVLVTVWTEGGNSLMLPKVLTLAEQRIYYWRQAQHKLY